MVDSHPLSEGEEKMFCSFILLDLLKQLYEFQLKRMFSTVKKKVWTSGPLLVLFLITPGNISSSVFIIHYFIEV